MRGMISFSFLSPKKNRVKNLNTVLSWFLTVKKKDLETLNCRLFNQPCPIFFLKENL